MTQATLAARRPLSVRGWARQNSHFLVAGSLMAAAALMLYVGVMILGWRFRKDPVPWPPGVVVAKGTFILTSLPRELKSPGGKAAFVSEWQDKDNDGRPDGDRIIRDDVMDSLKIGTQTDKFRWGERKSSWLLSRIYKQPDTENAAWVLDCYYYTGVADQVPHVPDRCLQAAGADEIGTTNVTFEVPGVPPQWRKVTFRRALYSSWDPKARRLFRCVQYYTFSFNGEPESDWRVVRLTLTYPWVRHVYYAKIQFGPAWPIADVNKTDEAAGEFVRCFLPKLLESLPMPDYIDKLRSAEKK